MAKGYEIYQNKDGYWHWKLGEEISLEYMAPHIAENASWTDKEQKELDRLNGI